jgi:mono/diheme cytochrome c family protein
MKVAAAVAILGVAVTLTGCDDMSNQPKRLPYELPAQSRQSPVWPALPPVGMVARDDKPVPAPPVTLALLERGRERFDIACAPCHARTGTGHGMIVERGFPAPPSYHIDRLRQAPAQHFYDVITNGYGIMFPYADRVAPADRWAIVAYIRALQASTQAHLADLPPDKRALLQ